MIEKIYSVVWQGSKDWTPTEKVHGLVYNNEADVDSYPLGTLCGKTVCGYYEIFSQREEHITCKSCRRSL